MDQLTAMRVFTAVAEEGGFAPAARRLGLSSSAVSRHIADLEQHLAIELIRRTTRRLSLTEAGLRYRARAETVLDEISAMDAEAGAFGHAPTGALRITSAPQFGEQFLAPVTAAFLRAYPEIKLDLDLSGRVVDLVAEGFDAALRSGPLPSSALRSRILAEPAYIPCASPDYLERAGHPRHPTDLTRHDCIRWWRTGPMTTWRFLDGETVIPVPVRGRFSVTSGLAQRHGALAGLGVALFLPGMVEADLAAGRLTRVLEDYPPERSRISLIWPPTSVMPLKLRVFIDFLVEALHKADAPEDVRPPEPPRGED